MRRPARFSATPPRAPTALVIVGNTSSGSVCVWSGTHTTPSGKSSTASAASWRASLVFPEPPGAGQRDETVGAKEPAGGLQLLLAADQGCRLDGQVRRVEAADRREPFHAELVEPNRLAQVLQPVTAKVAKLERRVE
jgi:hypothetical protein